MSKPAIMFMKDILKLDPKDRISTLQALRHPYFKGLNEKFLQSNRAVNKNRAIVNKTSNV